MGSERQPESVVATSVVCALQADGGTVLSIFVHYSANVVSVFGQAPVFYVHVQRASQSLSF